MQKDVTNGISVCNIFYFQDVSMRQTELHEVTPFTFTFGGDALAKLPDGRAAFVPFALPGEKVRVRLVEQKRGHARAEVVDILQAVDERIQPRCKHYTRCGGCHYQHMPYTSQLKAKAEIVRDQLVRIGGIANPTVLPIVPSPMEWNYRNNIQFHLAADGKLGFLAPDSHTVVPISECHLPEEALHALWPQLDFEAGSGLERVELRLGIEEEIMLVLQGNEPQAPEFSTGLAVSAVYLGGEEPAVLAGDQSLVMEVLGRPFQVSAQSFFQVNSRQAEALVQHLLDHLPITADATVLDVYSGVGLFGAFLAQRVGRVVGVEMSISACEDFAANLDEFDHVDLFMGPAEEILPGLELKPDIVVVDPPRSGVERAALRAIIDMQPAILAYVSCDPATLGRDARYLIEAGYQLKQVTPFDLFPQTFHIETVSLFGKQ
jgi:23S rRNA (uracil1939-C5)-methyltransferase